MIIPLILSIVFNVFSNATIFAVLSYLIELIADFVAIIKNGTKNDKEINATNS